MRECSIYLSHDFNGGWLWSSVHNTNDATVAPPPVPRLHLALDQQTQVDQVDDAQNDEEERRDHPNVQRGLGRLHLGLGRKHETHRATAQQHDTDDGQDDTEASVHAEQGAVLWPTQPNDARFQAMVAQILLHDELVLANVALALVGLVQPPLQTLAVHKLERPLAEAGRDEGIAGWVGGGGGRKSHENVTQFGHSTGFTFSCPLSHGRSGKNSDSTSQ